MQVIPEGVQKLWNLWGIRGMIFLSFLSQIILTLFGSRRKKSHSTWLRIILWSAYMTADWVAKFSLSALATIGEDCQGNISTDTIALQSFWASFLVLHLGGPDTITAYSSEDNELWLRHFLGLFVHVGVAIYILLRYWNNNSLSFLSFLVLSIGIVKYAERTWSLRSKSTKHLKDFTISLNSEDSVDLDIVDLQYWEFTRSNDGNVFLFRAYYLFAAFSCLFLNLVAPIDSRPIDGIVVDKLSNEIFNSIRTVFGLMYDVIYTKATMFCSPLGIFIRGICFISLIAALPIFSAIVFSKGTYQAIDIAITYFLLTGAVFVEVCSFVILTFSDWRKVWFLKLNVESYFHKPKNYLAWLMARYPISEIDPNRSWSELMGQSNLVSFCLNKVSNHSFGIWKLISINEELEKHLNVTQVEVGSHLQELILDYLRRKSSKIIIDQWRERGRSVLESRELLDQLKWCTIDAEFDESVFMWHIATDICYLDDIVRREGEYSSTSNNGLDSSNSLITMDISKRLSEYMLYIYIMRPSMMTRSEISLYEETCKYTIELFKSFEYRDKDKVCKRLLEGHTYKSDSMLESGRWLAVQLQALTSEKGWSKEEKWVMISEVWVQMLAYASSQCEWKEHVQQLRRGGELLTYVRFLMYMMPIRRCL